VNIPVFQKMDRGSCEEEDTKEQNMDGGEVEMKSTQELSVPSQADLFQVGKLP
jgi:hypothetical protein